LPGSLGWLSAEYFGSAEFLGLDVKSRATRRGVIEACLEEPLTPESKRLMRDCPYLRVDATHIMMLRDRKVKAGLPGAANNRRKYLSGMFSWAIEARTYGVKANPCRDAKKAATGSEGYHTWTVDEVLKFIERHPLGTTAHLAMCLMLFLGGRRQDAIRLGPKNVRTVTLRQPDGSNIHQRSGDAFCFHIIGILASLRAVQHALRNHDAKISQEHKRVIDEWWNDQRVKSSADLTFIKTARDLILKGGLFRRGQKLYGDEQRL
jgi:hypothetical protein